ncbi:MAG: L,D-transpeptidase [Butyrivibrio sp.]|nr:L,D-transpeptidase [Butyrivibrio sp.]
MKKVLRGISIGFLATIAILAIIYCLLGFYYRGGFPCFTWINGVYCTGKSVSEVNEELIAKDPYQGIAVLDRGDARLFVSAADTDYTVDYTDALNQVFYNRSPFAWGLYVFENLSYNYKPQVTMDKDKLSGIISQWEIFTVPSDAKCSLKMQTGEGFVLENAHMLIPVEDRITDRVYRCMVEGNEVVDLGEYEECYVETTLTPSEQERVELYEKLDKLQDFDVTYDFAGESVRLSRAVASGFILTLGDYAKASEEEKDPQTGSGMFIVGGKETELLGADSVYAVADILTDSEGNPIISEKRIYDFLSEAAEGHDTGWLMKRYKNGLSNEVILITGKKGSGTIYDVKAEFENVKNALISSGTSLKGTKSFPVVEGALTVDASEKLGSTFIEVDMKNQMLYYYVDGNLSIDMPVVTGNINRGRGTPAGVYNVYNKRYHTYLRGVDYVSYVNYWLGVEKGVGIHDANWRKKFGEEIYKSDGSHGCINCPIESVSELWEVAEVGTPVIMYY